MTLMHEALVPAPLVPRNPRACVRRGAADRNRPRGGAYPDAARDALRSIADVSREPPRHTLLHLVQDGAARQTVDEPGRVALRALPSDIVVENVAHLYHVARL